MQTLQSFLQIVKRIVIRSVTFGGKTKKQDGQEITTTQVSNKEKPYVYKEPSYIVATQETHFLNGAQWRTFTFEWQGSKYEPALLSRLLFEITKDTTLKQLPWPVKIIENNVDFGRSMLVVRKDVGLHLWWILVWLKRVPFNSRLYHHFKWRVIMTFEIWGLAYQPEGELTSWKNIGRKRKKK